VVGLVWGVIANSVNFIILNLIIAAGVGYAIGEVTSLSVNKKRGTGLAVIGGIAAALSYTISIFTFGHIPHGLFAIVLDLAGLGVGVYFAVNRLR
jgi:hypothetical protein